MPDLLTTNYGWTKPTVGADTNTWGGLLNADLDGIDSTVFAVSGVANAALPKAGGTMTGAILHAVGSVSAPGISFTGEASTGFYHPAGSTLEVAISGVA